MEMRHFDAFAAVMSAGSVTAAGALLGRSQPAVTRLIQELEDSLGYALFERSGPRITPTARAFQLYQEVERSLIGLHRIRERALAIANDSQAPLSIAATPSLASGILSQALARVQAGGLDLPPSLQVHTGSDEYVVESVLAQRFDIGLATLPLDHRGLEIHWIGEAPCVAVVHRDSPLAAQARIEWHDMAAHRLITLANAFRLRGRINAALNAACDGKGVKPAGLLETNTSVHAILAARAGLGIALVEPSTAYGAGIDGVVVRPLPVHIPFYFGAVTPYGKSSTPVATALLEALAQAASALQGFKRHEGRRHEALLQKFHGEVAPPPATLTIARPGGRG